MLMLSAVFLQVVPADQRHELLSRMSLFKLALHILLYDQAGFMISVDRFLPASVYMMLPAQMDFESPGFGDVPLPWAKIYVVLFGPLYAIVSVELLAQITSSVSRLYDTWRVLFPWLLVPPLRIQEISQ